jgi:hypothetical protein
MGLILKHFDKTGGGQITSKAWPDAFAGVAQTAEKFWLQNAGDRASLNLALSLVQAGDSDGSAMMRIGLDTATVRPPYGLAAVLSAAGAGGVFGATGVYEYLVTAFNATGETQASVPVSVNVDVTTKKVTLTWQQSPNAAGYYIYRTATPGTYGASTRRATINSGSSTTYVDDGAACAAGTPATENTTAGGAPNYGTPPSLGAGPLNLGVLKIGQWACYWANRVIPAGTSEAGNPRQSLRKFVES